MSQVTFPYERGTYRWTSGYGYRTDPLGRVQGQSFHGGVDLAPLSGAPIPTYSPVDGIVTVPSFEANGAGNNIWITDADQVLWKFFHLSAIWVKTGQRVAAGERVAMMGTTGASTGVHGHVERWQGGAYGNRTDPTTYLKEAETVGRYPGAVVAPTPEAPTPPTPTRKRLGMFEIVKFPDKANLWGHGYDRQGEFFWPIPSPGDIDPALGLPTRLLASGNDDLDKRFHRITGL